ncbi:CRISPR-associated helicase Cas3' [Methanofollis formosanus]|uniref:CRISPR-associated helicase Cas3 n=1 Tax=Methanofollis formosanus TaxID=299308 RepID=A0A8G1A2T8_9EURY|nr:CRISPR-associated helicase Cas3' [Methanofollis formosanus]QYZ80137.1 CRISPR-associated helicase Cas3' [Methanofollis formosanus]
MDSSFPLYFRYWGKSRTENDPDAVHLLPYHALDVAAVGSVLLNADTLLRERMARLLQIPEHQITPLVCFLLATHDIGKFSTPAFQLSDSTATWRLQGVQGECINGYHSDVGFALWKARLWDDAVQHDLIPLDGEFDSDDWQDLLFPLIKAVCGHHGTPPEDVGPIRRLFLPADIEAAEEFVQDAAALFFSGGAVPFQPEEELFQRVKPFSYLFAGFCVLCDWIGSDREYFRFCQEPMPLPKYWETALRTAGRAVREKGVMPARPSGDQGLERLFPGIFPESAPTDLQRYCAACPLDAGPHLFFIEDITGSGKTEAAVTLAHRLMARGDGEGMYFALPTMATANAMYARIQKTSDILFEDKNYSCILAHSASHLYGVMQTFLNDGTGSEQPGKTWLSDNRKKALLAQVGVGTIDQALLSILPVRHQSLRLFGLARNILVVDEVHACDSYMHKLLQRLLEFHAASGGSAILLSATMTRQQREDLARSFARGAGWQAPALTSSAYPLLTHLSSARPPHEQSFTDAKEKRVAVSLISSETEAEAALIETARSGGCACWVRNTVDDAVETYLRLKDALPAGTVRLFHARFALVDRLMIEKTVTEIFGKDSTPAIRAGQILVATQVVEQSLDLDFDLMVSDLAPVDRLVQRAGRVHRHARGPRGEARLIVLSPVVIDDPGEGWYSALFPRGAWVYPDHARLWLTARILVETGEIVVPRDARALVEEVFGPKSEDAIPEGFRMAAAQVRGEERADASFAAENALRLKKGYTVTEGLWESDARTPTRLGEPTVTLRLARWDGEQVLPWAEVSDRRAAWDLSQVSVREKYAAKKAEFASPLAEAVERARARMVDAGRYVVIVPLRPVGEVWEGSARDCSEKEILLRYSPTIGLMRDLQ